MSTALTPPPPTSALKDCTCSGRRGFQFGQLFPNTRSPSEPKVKVVRLTCTTGDSVERCLHGCQKYPRTTLRHRKVNREWLFFFLFLFKYFCQAVEFGTYISDAKTGGDGRTDGRVLLFAAFQDLSCQQFYFAFASFNLRFGSNT